MDIRSKFKQLLPAQPCVLCGSFSHHGLWCTACDAALPYLQGLRCPVCALPTPDGATCGHCLSHPPAFCRTTAVFAYRFPLDKLIQRMKYGEQLALAAALAGKLAQHIAPRQLPDYVIAMPLHPAKLRERGFNQSQLLAAAVARSLKLKLLTDACQRVRDTTPQSTLPWKQRKKNVQDAFRCTIDLAGKHVALVDDVLTTGASLNALAQTVSQSGASEVETWVIARTLPPAS